MTTQEVEEIKRHFDEAVQGLRSDAIGLRSDVTGLRSEMTAEFAQVRGELSQFRRDSAEVADHLMEKIADARHEARAQGGELRTLIQTVAEGVVLANERLDALTSTADAPRRTPPPRRH